MGSVQGGSSADDVAAAQLLKTLFGVEGELPADAVESVVQIARGGAAQIEHGVAVAAEPLHLAREARPALQVEHQPRFGKFALRALDLLAGGVDGERLAVELAEGEARGMAKAGSGTLVARGLAKGPDVARALRAVEDRWIAEGFPGEDRVNALADEVVAQALLAASSE